jgi:hypothetical protein
MQNQDKDDSKDDSKDKVEQSDANKADKEGSKETLGAGEANDKP